MSGLADGRIAAGGGMRIAHPDGRVREVLEAKVVDRADGGRDLHVRLPEGCVAFTDVEFVGPARVAGGTAADAAEDG